MQFRSSHKNFKRQMARGTLNGKSDNNTDMSCIYSDLNNYDQDIQSVSRPSHFIEYKSRLHQSHKSRSHLSYLPSHTFITP